MRGVYGWEGYGRWWALVEILREQTGYSIDITTEFAKAKMADELGMTTDDAMDFIHALIDRFQLLRTDGKLIWSVSLNRRMGEFNKIRDEKKQAGKRGAKSRWKKGENGEVAEDTNITLDFDNAAIDSDSTANNSNGTAINVDSTAIDFDSNRREDNRTEINKKEEKEREAAHAPSDEPMFSLNDVILFFTDLHIPDAQREATKFCNHYESIGWMKGRTPIDDWQAAARSWIDKMEDFTTKQHAHSPPTRGVSLTQQRVEFDPRTIERDTARALAELEAARGLNDSTQRAPEAPRNREASCDVNGNRDGT